MIRSAVLAFAAGTALVASPGSVLSPTVVDRPAQAENSAAPSLITTDRAGYPASNIGGQTQQHRSAAAALGGAAGAAAMTMEYQ